LLWRVLQTLHQLLADRTCEQLVALLSKVAYDNTNVKMSNVAALSCLSPELSFLGKQTHVSVLLDLIGRNRPIDTSVSYGAKMWTMVGRYDDDDDDDDDDEFVSSSNAQTGIVLFTDFGGYQSREPVAQ
jgi:hypothetical protein